MSASKGASSATRGHQKAVARAMPERVTPKDRRLAEPTQKELYKNKKSVHTGGVKYTVDSDVLFTNLQELLANTGLKGVNRKSIERLLSLSATEPGQSNGISLDAPFKDEKTGLLLPPPPPAETYGGHWHRLGYRLSPEDFLQAYWSDYVGTSSNRKHMLFAPVLRDADEHLDSAIRNQAKVAGIDYDEHYYRLGILTQRYALRQPYPGLEHQSALFMQLLAARRFQKSLPAHDKLTARHSFAHRR